MTFRQLTAAGAVLLLLAGAEGHAATEANFTAKTTGDVVTLCDPQGDTPMDNAGINFCEGFMLGAVLVEQQHMAAPRAHQFFCLPDPQPSRNAAMAAFVTWAKASPDRMAMGPIDGLMMFLGEQYPCPKHR